jgi:hypothetical protein
MIREEWQGLLSGLVGKEKYPKGLWLEVEG